jgi:uncharacterized membrane protein required for colicin V production
MGFIDIIIIVLAIISAFISYERGLVRQVLFFVAVFLGIFVGSRIVLSLSFPISNSFLRTLANLLIVSLVIAVLAFIAELISRKIHVKILTSKLYKPNRYLGIPVGIVAAIIICFIAGSLDLSTSSSDQQNIMLSSRIIRTIDNHSGYSFFYSFVPDHNLNIGQIVYGPGKPLDKNLDNQVDATDGFAGAIKADYPSVVRVVRDGCYTSNSNYEGSGYIAYPHIVVTAAHVVAGSGLVSVQTTDNKSYIGNVIYYSHSHDVAIIYAPSLPNAALKIDPSIQTHYGEAVAILGFPGSSPFEFFSGKLQRYGSQSKFQISDSNGDGNKAMFYQTDAAGFPGDSGGPLITQSGAVIGSFTIYSPTDPSYSATSDDLNPADIALTYSVALNDYYNNLVNSTKHLDRVSTGSCPDS